MTEDVEFSLPQTYMDGFHDLESVKRIKYFSLGKTGLQVSHVGFGASAVGGVYGKSDDQISIKVIQDAIRKGINYIDTAPWYGNGKSELVLGKALAEIPRSAYYLATKVGRYKPNVEEMFDFSGAKTLQSVDESLQRLNLEYVDIIQVHDVEFAPNLDIILTETLPALRQVIQSGKARFIGITGYPLEPLIEIINKSSINIDVALSYCRCSLFDNSLTNFVQFFQEKKVGLVNAAFLGMGLLTHQGPPSWNPAGQEIKEACKQAANYCKEMNVDISKLGLHFSLSQVGPQTHLVSFANSELLEQNLNTAANGLTDFEKTVLDHVIINYFDPLPVHHWEKQEVEKYWNKIKKLEQKVNPQ